MSFSISRNVFAPVNFDKAIWLLQIMHLSKNWVVCSSVGPKVLAFISHFFTNFELILDCFIPNFKLKYGDSEDIKADRVNTDSRFQLRSN